MRELTNNEIEIVSGGIEVSGSLTAVGYGFGSSPAVALLTASFFGGYKIGTFIYNTYTYFRY